MTFGAPHMALLLLLVPAIALLLWHGGRARRARLAAWAAPETGPRLPRGVEPWRRGVRATLLLLGLAACAFALTRPQWGYHYEEVKRRGIDLVIVVDVSESMLAEDVSPSRLERAKREISDFLDLMQGDRVALVAAAGTSFIQCPLTLDYAAVRQFLTLIDTDLIPTPGTDLAKALTTAARALETSGPSRGKGVVLISDGGNLEGDPAKVASSLHDQGITIYTVGIGNPDSAVPIPDPDGGLKHFEGKVVTTRLEEGVLRDIAQAGNGVYVRAVTGDLDLEKIYADIRERHSAAELGTSRRKVYHERFGWPLAFGLLCLALETIVPDRGRRAAVPVAAVVLALLAAPRVAQADVTSQVNRGMAAYAEARYDAALEAFGAAHDAAPDDPRTAFDLGVTQLRAGDAQAAAGLLEDAAGRARDDTLRAQSLYNAGNAYAKLGQFDRAVEAYERSLAIDPSDEDAKANLELVRQLIKRHEQEQQKRSEEQKRQNQKNQQQQQGNSGGKQQDQQQQQSQQSRNGGSDESPKPPQQQPQQQNADQNRQGARKQHPEEEQQAGGQPKPAGEAPQEQATAQQAAPAQPGAMDPREAAQWLRQLPNEDMEALKAYWRRQQPPPPAQPRRDW